MMKLLMLASAGGAIGAGLRFLVNQFFAARVPETSHGVLAFPWATFSVNVVGSFLMGVVYVYVSERLGGSPEARTFLATGILGGLTTFSAFSLDILNLMTGLSGPLNAKVVAYVVGSVALSFLALVAGISITRTGLAT